MGFSLFAMTEDVKNVKKQQIIWASGQNVSNFQCTFIGRLCNENKNNGRNFLPLLI